MDKGLSDARYFIKSVEGHDRSRRYLVRTTLEASLTCLDHLLNRKWSMGWALTHQNVQKEP